MPSGAAHVIAALVQERNQGFRRQAVINYEREREGEREREREILDNSVHGL